MFPAYSVNAQNSSFTTRNPDTRLNIKQSVCGWGLQPTERDQRRHNGPTRLREEFTLSVLGSVFRFCRTHYPKRTVLDLRTKLVGKKTRCVSSSVVDWQEPYQVQPDKSYQVIAATRRVFIRICRRICW